MLALEPITCFSRRCWTLRGQVQGVGFRPFVYRLAIELRLTGFVGNTSQGVHIEAQGKVSSLDDFERRLQSDAPPLARVSVITAEHATPVGGEETFRIRRADEPAATPESSVDVPPDAALCPACFGELSSDDDRRRNHALINCTNCGPRFTMIERIPYERSNTSMREFDMCPACADEYNRPHDRRFHAEAIACVDCGPRVTLIAGDGQVDEAPIAAAAAVIASGGIVAIKGIGGFHLAARADDARAIRRLRQVKRRDHKPLALMCRSLGVVRQLVHISDNGMAALTSPASPIVLAPRRVNHAVCDEIAGGLHRLGVMLPYTPLHHLLFAALGRQVKALVMTSGNEDAEPIITDDSEAVTRLPGSDCVLLHDRRIVRGVDDSVLIDVAGESSIPVRRARGYVPQPIELPVEAASAGIALGGEMKSTVALVRDGAAIVSQHLGDLKHPRALKNFAEVIDDLIELFGVQPRWIAHDMHPAYGSTLHAQVMAARLDVPVLAVQHHHAHVAALLAEHGLRGPVLGVVCDGTGYGDDGTIWGGELLLADLLSFKRLVRLRPLNLPGGDAAAANPWRSALAALHLALGEQFDAHPAADALVRDAGERAILARMIRGSIGCAVSSGAGRWFDAVAALLGLCTRATFDGQAAMMIEAAAHRHDLDPSKVQPLYTIGQPPLIEIDLSPVIRQIITQHRAGVDAAALAALFHAQFARAWADVAARASGRTGIRTIGLSGGVFCNEILTRHLTRLLSERGLTVLRHRVVPPNDGGLSLGQAAIAAARSSGGA